MNDLRYALRLWTRNPGYALIIVSLLALGIGACTTMFALVDAVLLRPLPVSRPEQLVRMVQQLPRMPARSYFPFAYYESLRNRATTVAAFGETADNLHFRLTSPEPAEAVTVHATTPNYFQVLGVHAFLGRLFETDDEVRLSGTPPVVLSYDFWLRRFHGAASVVRGRTLEINGHRFAIIGVLPPGFNGLSVDTAPDMRTAAIAFPLITDYKLESSFFEVAGRLKPGFDKAQTQAECLSLWQSTMQDYYLNVDKFSPEQVRTLLQRGMKLESAERGTSVLRSSFGEFFVLLMAAVTLLMLIIALNVAGLLLARIVARQKEIAERLAIGGTHLRVVRHIVNEALVLSVFGAFGGLMLSLAGIPLTVHLLPPMRDISTAAIPLTIDTHVNWRVLLFLVILAFLTTLFSTVLPALVTFRFSIEGLLRSARSGSNLRGRELIITGQIALCTLLLVSAGLLVRSAQQLEGTPSGFARDSVATFSCDLESYKLRSGVLSALINNIREVPGVVSVATSSIGVMRGHGRFANVAAEGHRVSQAEFMATAANSVSMNYFETMGVRLLAGRDFIPADEPHAKQTTPVRTVVNEAFARRFFPGVDPVGKRFGTAMEGAIAHGDYEIIGVVSDAKYRSLKEPIRPMFFSQETDFDSFVLYVRTSTQPAQVIGRVRKVASSAFPDLPFLEVNTLAHEVEESTAPERMTALVASLFGAFAALLAGIGIYGLLAYAVTQRRREISIRMALGANVRDVSNLIGLRALGMVLAGITLGLVAALIATPTIQPFLYGITSTERGAFVAAAAFVLLIAAVATTLPVLRAIGIQPAEILRLEN